MPPADAERWRAHGALGTLDLGELDAAKDFHDALGGWPALAARLRGGASPAGGRETGGAAPVIASGSDDCGIDNWYGTEIYYICESVTP